MTVAKQTRVLKDVPVWITEHDDPSGLLPGSKDSSFVRSCNFSFGEMQNHGWTRTGVATITVELIDEKALIANKVESLNVQLRQVRADAEVRCNRILEQISKLQALEFTA